MSTAAPKWASDGNEPESNDTITRGATAVSNQIKSSPSQSRMAVHDHTSIDDVVCEVLFSHRCREYHTSMVMIILLFIFSQFTHQFIHTSVDGPWTGVRLALLFILVCVFCFCLFCLPLFGSFSGFLRKCYPCCFFFIVRMEISLFLWKIFTHQFKVMTTLMILCVSTSNGCHPYSYMMNLTLWLTTFW